MTIQFTKVERVSFEDDLRKEAEFWAKRSMAERVLAGWQLAEDDLLRKASDDPQGRTTFSVRRVRRSWR